MVNNSDDDGISKVQGGWIVRPFIVTGVFPVKQINCGEIHLKGGEAFRVRKVILLVIESEGLTTTAKGDTENELVHPYAKG
jgi:hypothetical protein